MDILLNPNLIYLLLTGGLLLAILALASPGTGVLEILALLILGAAGLGMLINQQFLNLWALPVLLVGVVFFFLALRRPRQRIYLVLAYLCIVFGSAYIFENEVWWIPAVNPLLAGFISLLWGGFLWVVSVKVVEADRQRPSHDLAVLMEDIGEAKTLVYKEGSVQIAGELWSAYSDAPIPAGTPVRAVSRDGFRIKVQPAGEASEESAAPR